MERTIAALRAAGRLTAVDDAVLAVVRTLAAELDASPSAYVAGIVGRVELAAIAQLIGGAAVEEVDELAATLRLLRSDGGSGPLGDAAES